MNRKKNPQPFGAVRVKHNTNKGVGGQQLRGLPPKGDKKPVTLFLSNSSPEAKVEIIPPL
jgi:hypothetical protein